LGYLSFSGEMDFNILIRTILKIKSKVYFGVGGGIVADSQPEAEYNETLVKAEGIMRALGAK
jgi:para-aminobenzoate synthetase component 1